MQRLFDYGSEMMKASNKVTKRFFATLLCLSVAATFLPAAAENKNETAESEIKTYSSSAVNDNSYFNYYQKYMDENKPKEIIEVVPDKTDFVYDGKKATVLGLNKNTFNAKFNVKETGIYFARINYLTLKGDASKIQVSMKINNRFLFDEAQRIELFRTYEDEISNKKFETDKYGNDIRPSSKETYHWQELDLSDYNSLYSEPSIFYLTAGENTISVKSENSVAISKMNFYNPDDLQKYSDYIKSYEKENVDISIRQEAELVFEKNDDNIYPTYEKTDAATLPIDAATTKLNTIGQSNWSKQGQKISWKAEVKNAGLYAVSFRVNQSYNEYGSSFRRLTINGEVPFAEASSIEFPYAVKWYVKTLGDENPYYVYLKPGDIITLECVADKTCKISRNIMDCLSRMSAIYREIFVITGAYPDMYTDYNLDVKIPDLMEQIKSIKKSLNDTVNLIVEITGKKNSAASTLTEIIDTYDIMIEKPYDIHKYVSKISDNITSMGSLVTSIGTQPLEIDCLYYDSYGKKISNGKVSAFKRLKYNVQRFLASYASVYGSFTGEKDKLNVWVTTGRDQLQILQKMVENNFENNHDIKVELSLVDTGATLLKATIAGKGPDVALMIPTSNSINLAFRDAVVDLSKYDISSIYGDFYESAWTPLKFKDGIYGIPESAIFNMLFYRTDVFDMLNIDVPDNWKDFYSILEILQRNNYEVGIQEIGANAGVSEGIGTFSTFLLQRGGTYYSPDYKKTAFDSEEAYSAFVEWVELYSKYSLDRSFDFFNRFRTGVMALAVQPYSAYNQLYSAAPEIRGLWAMAPIPGTLQSNGTLDRSENANITGCMMLKSAEEKALGKQAFEFMKWWSGAEIQSLYANELEAAMGMAARYAPANIEAFGNVGWKSEEFSVLKQQFSQTKNFREVPGNYVLSRSLTSAFRNALNSSELPERQLELYNKDINEEMERKAKEFGIY